MPHAWYVRSGRLANDLWSVRCHLGDEHPDGEIVAVESTDAAELWRVSAAEPGIAHIEIADFAAPGAQPVWYVYVPEPKATPPAATLVAFATDDFAPGTVISNMSFASRGIVDDDQVAAIRWYPSTGIVHQVFVGEQWRRQHAGTHLIYAASAFHQANGWPGRLHSDGRRTELGQRFAAGLAHPQRIAALTETMPPMDPSPAAS